MLALRYETPARWTEVVLSDFDPFLQDHAANEYKVSQAALQLVRQHPTKHQLCEALIEVAREELEHFQQVYALLSERGKPLGQDAPDPYMGALRRGIRREHVDPYLLDRLVLFAVVEARGCERLGLLSRALTDPALRAFYTEVTGSEARHRGLYLRLARHYFDEEQVAVRLDALLDLEAKVIAELPLRPALH